AERVLLLAHPTSPLFPYTTLFRSIYDAVISDILYRFRVQFSAQYLHVGIRKILNIIAFLTQRFVVCINQTLHRAYKRLLFVILRSEEHTSELQSRFDLV